MEKAMREETCLFALPTIRHISVLFIPEIWRDRHYAVPLQRVSKDQRGRFFQSLRLVKAAEPSASDHFLVSELRQKIYQ